MNIRTIDQSRLEIANAEKVAKFDTTCDEDLVKANYIKPAACNRKTLKTAYRPSKLFPFNVIKIFDWSFPGVGKHVFCHLPMRTMESRRR